MTRIAIVAASEELRTRLVTALSKDPTFEIVAVAATTAGVGRSADLLLVARDVGQSISDEGGGALRQPDVLLTNREREILALLADGLGNKQIAVRLGISTNTVKTHLELLFEKIGVSSRAEAVAAGVRRGLLML